MTRMSTKRKLHQEKISDHVRSTKRVKYEEEEEDAGKEEDVHIKVEQEEAITKTEDYFPCQFNTEDLEIDAPERKETAWSESESKRRFNKLWSNDDEITVLQGMLDFFSVKGRRAASNDMTAFYEFIKDSLHVNVSKRKLMNKVKRLKKKYVNVTNNVDDGGNGYFSTTHDEKLSTLSRKIWGANVDEDDYDVEAVKDHDHLMTDHGNSEAKQKEFWSLFPRLDESLQLQQFSEYTLPGSGMSFVKERLSSIGSTKAGEFEIMWRKLQVAEAEVKLMRAQLIQEQTKLILDAIN